MSFHFIPGYRRNHALPDDDGALGLCPTLFFYRSIVRDYRVTLDSPIINLMSVHHKQEILFTLPVRIIIDPLVTMWIEAQGREEVSDIVNVKHT